MEILKTEALDMALIKAGEIIRLGGVVALPTESFYGLAVNPMDEGAVERLFILKGRERNNPILLLIDSRDRLEEVVATIPERTIPLISHFWPGGLTMIFQAKHCVSPKLTAGTGKIGIRLSSHPLPTALAGTVGAPITGTSANITGQPPCVSAEEVSRQLGHGVDLILDGGETVGGRGSTILDVTVNPPVILREGMVTRAQLAEFLF